MPRWVAECRFGWIQSLSTSMFVVYLCQTGYRHPAGRPVWTTVTARSHRLFHSPRGRSEKVKHCGRASQRNSRLLPPVPCRFGIAACLMLAAVNRNTMCRSILSPSWSKSHWLIDYFTLHRCLSSFLSNLVCLFPVRYCLILLHIFHSVAADQIICSLCSCPIDPMFPNVSCNVPYFLCIRPINSTLLKRTDVGMKYVLWCYRKCVLSWGVNLVGNLGARWQTAFFRIQTSYSQNWPCWNIWDNRRQE